ncbi:glycosyltransferase family 4 protein [Motilimonas pumila]|uniref:Glycosyltransferase family 1 protein n=1 Tax=Motilimonas pumila TaxID=2303987 RepID=A0A418YD63_9GAMM|nr:glycosyltransferase family 4 protein [Motilimonas pumila]RJG42471.1 glycosyltransferase family 1 protein [Motilimonas pumila]
MQHFTKSPTASTTMMAEEETNTVKRILFVHYGDNWIRGSERCLLDLMAQLQQQYFQCVLWCNQSVLAQQAKALGVTVYRSDFPAKLPLFQRLSKQQSFNVLVGTGCHIVKKHNIQCIHVNNAAPGQWVSQVAKQSQLPWLVQLHGIYFWRDRIYNNLYQANRLVGVSDYVMRDLKQEQASPTQKYHVISNGIDTDALPQQGQIDLRSQLGISRQDYVFAHLGSLIKRKGVDTLLWALALRVKQGGAVHLLIIGSGPEQQSLMQLSRDLGICAHVSFLGEQDTAFAILAGTADCLVSGAKEEAFGLVAAEAGLAKLPAIVPDIGGLKEVVVDQQTGCHYPVNDSHRLCQLMAKYQQQPELAKQHGHSGYIRVCHCFNMAQNAAAFARSYQDIASANGSSYWRNHTALIGTYSLSIFNTLKRKLNKGLAYE